MSPRSEIPVRWPRARAAASALLLAAALGAPRANSAISFVEPLSAPLGFTSSQDGVAGLAYGDFNGDGKLDLAATLDVGNRGFTAILLGNGDGTFQAPVRHPNTSFDTGAKSYGIIARDFDGDGKMDVLTASYQTYQLLFWKGRGDGTLRNPVARATTNRLDMLQVADLDGDGKLDAVAGSSSDARVEVFKGNGDGTFQAGTVIVVPGGPIDIALANVDGTNRADIALLFYSGSQQVGVLLNDGSGGFPGPLKVSTSNVQTIGFFVGLYDGDAMPDVVVAGYHGGEFLRGNGDGTFVTPNPADKFTLEYAPGRYYTENVAPDLDGDDNLDAVFMHPFGGGRNTVSIALGDGAGHFTTSEYVASQGPADGTTFRADVCKGAAAVVADFDGDDSKDIAAGLYAENGGGRPGDIAVLLGNGNGTFAAPRVFAFPQGYSDTIRSSALADFTNDLKLDVAMLANSGVALLPGNGDGTFGTALPGISGVSGGVCCALRAADFDKDGSMDAAFTGGSRINVAWGNGNGTFAAPAQNFVVAGDPRNTIVGDFNKDTYPDFATWVDRGGSAHVEVWLYVPGTPRTFSRAADIDVGTHQAYENPGIVAGDFDKDTNPDLLTFSGNGGTGDASRLIFLKGNGNGTFVAPVNRNDGVITSFTSEMKAADLDGDTNLDAVIAAIYGGVWIARGNGNGTFQAPVYYSYGGGYPCHADVGDLDGDTKPDVAAACSSSGFGVRRGNGDGTLGPLQYFAVGESSAFHAHIGHLNGDAKPDVVVMRNSGTGHFAAVLLNDSGLHAELSLAKVPDIPNPLPGQTVTFTITATNAGPDAATNVVVRDPIRSGLAVQSVTPSQGSCQQTAALISCSLGTLAASASATLQVQVKPGRSGSLTNTASVSSDTPETLTFDNGAASTLGLSVLRGDANDDLVRNVSDILYLINYLFVGGPPPPSLVNGDADASSAMNVSDVLYMINFLFAGGPAPPA